MYNTGTGTPKDVTQATFWFMKAKKKEDLLSIFQASPLQPLTVTPPHDEDEIDAIEAELLSSWQTMVVQKARDRKDAHSILHYQAYQHLEQKLARFLSLRQKLKTQTGLMISCLKFKDEKNLKEIEVMEQNTGFIPYVKQHTLHSQIYVSIGKKNVKLADEIIINLSNTKALDKVNEILKELETSYTKVRNKFGNKAVVIEKKLQLPDRNVTKDAKHLKKLSLYNELASTFSKKREATIKEAENLKAYYDLFRTEIEEGQHHRNHKFREENHFLFEPS